MCNKIKTCRRTIEGACQFFRPCLSFQTPTTDTTRSLLVSLQMCSVRHTLVRVSCSSERKHDTRTMPRAELLVSARRLHEQRQVSRKLSLFQISVKMDVRKVSTAGECVQEQDYLLRRGDCRIKGHNTEKSVLSSSSGEVGFSVNRKLIAVND